MPRMHPGSWARVPAPTKTAWRSALRDRMADSPEILEARGLRIDIPAHEVTRDGEELFLTRREFNLLLALVRNRGRVLSGAQLLDLAWGRAGSDTRTVTV